MYLDGTHSAWLGVGDTPQRLVKAGVQRARGFLPQRLELPDDVAAAPLRQLDSGCIAYATNPADGGWRLGHFDYCASQYYPASPDDESTWHLTDEWYAANLAVVPSPRPPPTSSSTPAATARAPGRPPATHPAGDPEVLVQPARTAASACARRPGTGNPLADAFLWIKTPGQSDGQCHRWTTGPVDPVRGIVDPAAGDWFPDMALELVHNANPPIVR